MKYRIAPMTPDVRHFIQVGVAFVLFSAGILLCFALKLWLLLVLMSLVCCLVGTWQRLQHRSQMNQLQAQRALLLELIEGSPDGLFVFNQQGVFISVNQAACELTGYHRPQLEGMSLKDLLLEQEWDRVASVREAGEHWGVQVNEWQIRHQAGDEVYVEVHTRQLPNGHWQAQARDIGERKRQERILRLSASVFENTRDAILIADSKRRIVAVNPAFERVTGYASQEVVGRTPRFNQSGRHDAAFYQAIDQALATQGRWQGEIWNQKKNGEIYPVREVISVVKDAAGQVQNYVGQMTDITDYKINEDKLSHLAHHDSLTELPNRLAFMQHLEQGVIRARRSQKKMALLFCDLNGFKMINDNLGHDMGDRLLVNVAERLQACLREDDTVCRLGGDEFTIILQGIESAPDVARLANKLIAAIAKPMMLGDRKVCASVSIGISLYPDDADNAKTLMTSSDTAMYRAKREGGGRYAFFTTEMAEQIMARTHLMQQLHMAIEQQQLVLHYQPQISFASGHIIGAEALLRWDHPQLGLLRPDDFLPVAEEAGIMTLIGSWVVQTALAQASLWRAQGLAKVTLSVNMSGRQIIDERLLASVKASIQHHGPDKEDGAGLEIEVHGSDLPKHEAVNTAMAAFKAIGFSIAIDDFGRRDGSLNPLRDLPVNTLKIGCDCFQGGESEAVDETFVRALVAFGHGLGLKVIAEGVETESSYHRLQAAGCDEFQGYLASKPVTAEVLESMMLTNKTYYWVRPGSGEAASGSDSRV